MINRLRNEGIGDERVLTAMAEVPRHEFVSAAQERDAYGDTPLSIGAGQTVSTPWVVAFSAAALELKPDSTVLEIGTGSGYGAAVLSRCCRWVVTVERHPELAESAREKLVALGYDNIEVRTGDGSAGVEGRAPFSGILVTAMAQRGLPSTLTSQLAQGGILVCPVGAGSMGSLVRYRDGKSEDLLSVGFVPLVEDN